MYCASTEILDYIKHHKKRKFLDRKADKKQNQQLLIDKIFDCYFKELRCIDMEGEFLSYLNTRLSRYRDKLEALYKRFYDFTADDSARIFNNEELNKMFYERYKKELFLYLHGKTGFASMDYQPSEILRAFRIFYNRILNNILYYVQLSGWYTNEDFEKYFKDYDKNKKYNKFLSENNKEFEIIYNVNSLFRGGF